MGLRKREALRGVFCQISAEQGLSLAPGSTQQRACQSSWTGTQAPYEVSCVLPFLTGQQVAPEEDICTNYILKYRKELLERTGMSLPGN